MSHAVKRCFTLLPCTSCSVGGAAPAAVVHELPAATTPHVLRAPTGSAATAARTGTVRLRVAPPDETSTSRLATYRSVPPFSARPCAERSSGIA